MFLCLLSGRDTCCLPRWDKMTTSKTERRRRAGRGLTTHTAASRLSGEIKRRHLVRTWLTMKMTTATQKRWLPGSNILLTVVEFPEILTACAPCVHVCFLDKLERRASWRQQTPRWSECGKQTVVKRGQRIKCKRVCAASKCFLVKWQLDFAVPACDWFGFWAEERITRERR